MRVVRLSTIKISKPIKIWLIILKLILIFDWLNINRYDQVYISASDLGYKPVIKSWFHCRKIELYRGDEFEKTKRFDQ